MPKGGARVGAGRKPGPANDKGIRAAHRAEIREIMKTETDPLKKLIAIYNDPNNSVELQTQAAGMALPFVHPRLSAMVMANVTPPAAINQDALAAKLLDLIAKREAAKPPTIEHQDEAA